MHIGPASWDTVHGVQQGVLRPNGPLPGDLVLPHDWLHLAAHQDGVVIGAVSLGPADWPRPDLADLHRPTWQLARVAVLPGHRDQGVGSALVSAAVATARTHGAGALWARARVAALPMYLRVGWTIVGLEWDKPGVGPHRYIWTRVA